MLCEIPILTRYCFCLPLRRSIIMLGYLYIVFAVYMIYIYSIHIHNFIPGLHGGVSALYHGTTVYIPEEMSIALYCVEIVFNCILLYGAHRGIVLYLKLYLYYVIMTIVTVVILEIINISRIRIYYVLETFIFVVAGVLLQIYLAILVRSLINKLEVGDTNSFDNQLHEVETGEQKIESGVSDNINETPN